MARVLSGHATRPIIERLGSPAVQLFTSALCDRRRHCNRFNRLLAQAPSAIDTTTAAYHAGPALRIGETE
jgi:hypothetical protein